MFSLLDELPQRLVDRKGPYRQPTPTGMDICPNKVYPVHSPHYKCVCLRMRVVHCKLEHVEAFISRLCK
jgi:hypothetical protein